MKKHLLIPLDGSEFSTTIIAQVVDLLEPKDYRVKLLRVTEPPKNKGDLYDKSSEGWALLMDWAYLITPDLQKTLTERQARQVAYFEKELTTELVESLRSAKRKLEAAGFEVDVDIRFGHPVEQIKAFIDEHPIDIVAMSTHGRSGLAKVLMGSVTMSLLSDCPVPIMMLRPNKTLAAETLTLTKTATSPAGV